MSDHEAVIRSLTSEDPVENMEAAKRIIGGLASIDLPTLAKLTERGFPKWSRIAAIYAIGFIDRTKLYAPLLRQILSDETNDPDVRSHAAEALGNLHDSDAAILLRDVLGRSSQTAIRESCEYALGELRAA